MKKLALFLFAALICAGCSNQKRTIISLNGEWQIEEGSMDRIPDNFTHKIRVPGLVSLARPEFRNAGPRVRDRGSIDQVDSLREAFWYRTNFSINKRIPQNAFLKISKAMFGTRVVLNGKDLGEHLPCFTPGWFNTQGVLKRGKNELLVRVGSCRNSLPKTIPDGFDFEKERYIPGIFDDVELILTGNPRIISAQAAPDIYSHKVRVRVNLGDLPDNQTADVNFIIRESVSGKIKGRLNSGFKFSATPGSGNYLDVNIPIDSCRLWSPEDPFLYDLIVSTSGDEYHTRFGMREFRYDTLRAVPLLNGQPYYLRGTNATLYRFFEDDSCRDLPWNADWVRKLHRSFKDFHWNSIRYCIGIAPESWYRIADEEGILIQNEFPVWYGGKGWNKWPPELKSDELEKEYTEWITEQWNHPSIVIWDASNETVSDDGNSEEIAAAISKVRSLDLSGRPWDNSYSQVRKTGDVMELHPYHFQNPDFKLSDMVLVSTNPATSPRKKPETEAPAYKNFMKIVNEYGWLWLNRDGTPTTLTKDLYHNLLGENSSEIQRRHLYSSYMAAETEFWRCHRLCSGVMHFTVLGYSRPDGQTSDHFISVRDVRYDPEFRKYMTDAFSPVGLMLDEWGTEIKCGTDHNFRVIAINDLGKEWKGNMLLQIMNNDTVFVSESKDIIIPPEGQAGNIFNLKTPSKRGTYNVIASLSQDNMKSVRSIREIMFR